MIIEEALFFLLKYIFRLKPNLISKHLRVGSSIWRIVFKYKNKVNSATNKNFMLAKKFIIFDSKIIFMLISLL